MLYYSPGTCGFYDDKINSDIPKDSIEVTGEERSALLAGQGSLKVIAINSEGRPVLVDRTVPPEQVAARSDIELESRTTTANAKILLLAGRVDTLSYLLSDKSEQPAAAEIAELPVCEAQLKAWRQYSVSLGRITSSDGWPQAPAWPDIPE
ncbi:tail fiber assembly protein [Pseudomonas veronii]|uniref:tail fiber assembly protein n=1 Tax=Pseudomonas veronii TaxID=76761 RepID=UPI001E3C0A45|nr:tail fiber assembly protein [Pseudomonas veronii]UHH28284.1 tail fiber assembly protein [Pseudomonas veronii]